MMIINILFFVVFGTQLVTGQKYEGDRCNLMNSTTLGECRLDRECPSFMKLAKNKKDLKNAKFLFRMCGFNRSSAIVCCPEFKVPVTSNPLVVTPRLETKNPMRISMRKCSEFASRLPPSVRTQILGGVAVELGDFPHMVALGYLKSNGYEFNCGGSLISENYVLTAAHCTNTIDDEPPTIVKVGTIYTNDSRGNIEIESITDHPEYIRALRHYDISLIKLRSNIEIKAYLHPACLYTSSENPQTRMVATGWGVYDTARNRVSERLLRANFSAVSNTECGIEYTRYFADANTFPGGIRESNICAIDRVADTCTGDSGGPLQIPSSYQNMWSIVGLTSFGRSCGTDAPAVYTRVSSFLDWIERTVWSNGN